MKTKKIIGIIVLIVLGASYFINIPTDSGENFVTYDTLLGILIFHNPFVLIIYFLAAVVLIFYEKIFS